MGYKVLNNAYSTLAISINAAVTSLTVATGHGDRFPVIAGADYTYITLEDASSNIEIVKVTARATSSDVLTIERAQDGTTARSWAAGDIVELRVIAALLDLAIAHVDDTSGAHLASAITNTPSGNVTAITVQAAINELDSDLTAAASSLASATTAVSNALTSHLNDTSDAHDASAISYAGGTGISATDVEGAIDELATEKANLAGAAFTSDITVPDEAYDATGWNADSSVPTKNAVRDKMESVIAGIPTTKAALNTLITDGDVVFVGDSGTTIKTALSAAYTGVSGETLQLAHGQASVPSSCKLIFECISADGGYSVGDRAHAVTAYSGSAVYTFSPSVDATNCTVKIASGYSINLNNKSTGATHTPTATKWKYYFEVVL
ncbi:MAG: hypothetical protein WC733_00155 [Methylophilus sp.]|jgi:hypothetical protein